MVSSSFQWRSWSNQISHLFGVARCCIVPFSQLLTDVDWGDLDYLIIDLPPGTGDAQLTLAQVLPLSGTVVVTQPMQVAASDAVRGLKMFEKLEVPIWVLLKI